MQVAQPTTFQAPDIPVRWSTTDTFPIENRLQIEWLNECDAEKWMNPHNDPNVIVKPQMVSPNGVQKTPDTLQEFAIMVFREGYKPTCNIYKKVADDWICQIMIIGFIEAAQPSKESKFTDFKFTQENAVRVSREVLRHNDCDDASGDDEVLLMSVEDNKLSMFVGDVEFMREGMANEMLELVAWGDIDGDGVEDVLAKIHYDLGGTGNGDVCIALEFNEQGVLVEKE